MPATGLVLAAHSQTHSAELRWQHPESQYRELGQLQSAQEGGHHGPLRRLLAKKAAAAAAAADEEDEGADDSYDDDMDLDEPMAAGRAPSPLTNIYIFAILSVGVYGMMQLIGLAF